MHGSPTDGVWLTSVAFSSTQGGKCILATGRTDGSLILKSIYDALPRFEIQQPFPVACLSWRPTCSPRSSQNPFNPGAPVQTEDLVVGDETGTLYYYVVEWPMGWEVARDTWPGSMMLVAKISLHNQQICGLAWSPNGRLFASGGNDNMCCLFDVDDVLEQVHQSARNELGGLSLPRQHLTDYNDDDEVHGGEGNTSADIGRQHVGRRTIALENGALVYMGRELPRRLRHLGPGSERQRWIHGAAVKAIAFCPWREGLIATGGGSNDKCIHFFNTTSGSAIATIAVSAQVTALIWSSSRREIAATFGYAQPQHPYRIAIFNWPDCSQVTAIPWEAELRAVCAIPYPWSPSGAPERRSSHVSPEGCIIVASSDKSVKFYRVWSIDQEAKKKVGVTGRRDTSEDLRGADVEVEVIR